MSHLSLCFDSLIINFKLSLPGLRGLKLEVHRGKPNSHYESRYSMCISLANCPWCFRPEPNICTHTYLHPFKEGWKGEDWERGFLFYYLSIPLKLFEGIFFPFRKNLLLQPQFLGRNCSAISCPAMAMQTTDAR